MFCGRFVVDAHVYGQIDDGFIVFILLAATAHYINEMAKVYGISSSRIAHGVPLGGELEYVDSGTLSHAFSGRRRL